MLQDEMNDFEFDWKYAHYKEKKPFAIWVKYQRTLKMY